MLQWKNEMQETSSLVLNSATKTDHEHVAPSSIPSILKNTNFPNKYRVIAHLAAYTPEIAFFTSPYCNQCKKVYVLPNLIY
jgi:hypothetical protein